MTIREHRKRAQQIRAAEQTFLTPEQIKQVQRDTESAFSRIERGRKAQEAEERKTPWSEEAK
jgi:hypothetical protein